MGMMQQRKINDWFTLIAWTFLCILCMVVMLLFAHNKTIKIVDNAGENSNSFLAYEEERPLTITTDNTIKQRLCIPLKNGWKVEKISVENRYIDKELWIYIGENDLTFYADNPITGDVSSLLDGTYQVQDEGIVLRLSWDNIWEYQSIVEENCLYIEYLPPKEVYEHIVVIDPGCGGADVGIKTSGLTEKELNLQIAQLVKQKLDKESIKVYYTRKDDVEVPDEKRVELTNALSADMYIGIHASEDKGNAEMYGTTCIYNANYFIPEFGNVELADSLLKEVVTSVSGRAVGLVEASQDDMLNSLEIPAVAIQVGYLTNEVESSLLKQTFYQEKIADGIIAAIKKRIG